MTVQLGVVMDSIESIKPSKDSTLAMLLAAQKRGWELHYFQQEDLFLRDSKPFARMQRVAVRDDESDWFTLDKPEERPLTELDTLLMRKDPPVDMRYIHTTHFLELAVAAGALIVNKPQSLRDANEKLYTAWFPQCCPATLVSCNMIQLRKFLKQQGDIIVKPLEGMGGMSVFRLRREDSNVRVTLETLTQYGRQQIMAQRYLPEIAAGDKRILLIDGEPVPYALARIPAKGETRGNLAAGAQGKGVALSDRDRWICEQIGPTLKEKGLIFVGIDVIGDYLTEINVTSPTCIRELDRQYNLDIAGHLIETIRGKLGRVPNPHV